MDEGANQGIVQSIVIDVAPMGLVPMSGGGDGGIALTQFEVAVGQELQGETRGGIFDVVTAATQPQANENLALQTEGDDVVAKRLIFGHS